jgi:O-Antigen ligase
MHGEPGFACRPICGDYVLSRTIAFFVASPVQFWALGLLLIVASVSGGSSRSDVQSLTILQPLSFAACGLAVSMLSMAHARQYRWLLGCFGAVIFLLLLHVIPLPPHLLAAMPGREVLTSIDTKTGLAETWRPLSLAPAQSWSSVVSIVAPLAVVLLGIQLDRRDLYRLLPLVIALGAFSGVIGLLQLISGSESSLYLYEVTNNGAAVGLFANRNHSALLLACLFPMLAIYSVLPNDNRKRLINRPLLAVSFAIVLVPLILVTGSRSGLLMSMAALLGAFALYMTGSQLQPTGRKPPMAKSLPLVLLGLAIVCLVLATLVFSRAEAIDRLVIESAADEQRGGFWSASVQFMQSYMPWGSGSGSFAVLYQMEEPWDLLDTTYLNRAHNDILEIIITLGLPGGMFVIAGGVFLGWRAILLWFRGDVKRRSVLIARMASLTIILMIGASIVDYPIRTPFLMCVLALLVLWLVEPYEVITGQAVSNISIAKKLQS